MIDSIKNYELLEKNSKTSSEKEGERSLEVKLKYWT